MVPENLGQYQVHMEHQWDEPSPFLQDHKQDGAEMLKLLSESPAHIADLSERHWTSSAS